MHDAVTDTAPTQTIPTWVDREDEASSVSSESCWGEMEDFGEDDVEWGLLPCNRVNVEVEWFEPFLLKRHIVNACVEARNCCVFCVPC